MCMLTALKLKPVTPHKIYNRMLATHHYFVLYKERYMSSKKTLILFNTPGVAKAVLQTASSLADL